MPPRIEPVARLENDSSRVAVDVDGAAAAGAVLVDRPRARVEEVERSVVARRHERVVDRGVEAPAGAYAGGDCKLRELQQLGADLQRACGVEPRELRLGQEAREEALEPPELLLRLGERGVALRVEQELHLRPHRPE